MNDLPTIPNISSTPNINLPIVIAQGATLNLPIYIVDLVCGQEVPTDLTGWTAAMQGRQTYGSTNVLFDISTDNGGISIIDTEGAINCSITATVTSTFPNFFKGVYDLKLFLPTGEVDRIIQGTLFVSPEVTQETYQ